MAYRFYRTGLTPNLDGPNVSNTALFTRAQSAVPNGTTDDPDDYSNLSTNGDTDPVYVGELDRAHVWLYSDSTSSGKLRVKTGPTPDGPWNALGTATTDNPALASPVVFDVFEDGRCEYVKITTTAAVSGNLRALLVGLDF